MSNFTKFFRNGKTFSAFCRMRYGQSKDVWADTTLWEKTGRFVIAFDQDAADDKFSIREHNPLKPAHCEEAFDEENYSERRQEAMMDYLAANGNLNAYYEDQAAGYTY